MCERCEPSHKREMPYMRSKNRPGFSKQTFRVRIGKGLNGDKYKKHQLMLLDRAGIVASIKIEYCPFCGRKLEVSNGQN